MARLSAISSASAEGGKRWGSTAAGGRGRRGAPRRPVEIEPVGAAPDTALHEKQLAWWVAEARASDQNAFAAQASTLWRLTPRAIARVVLGGAALERGAANAPEAGVISCVELARAFGGEVRPIDGAHLALQEKIFGAQQPPPS